MIRAAPFGALAVGLFGIALSQSHWWSAAAAVLLLSRAVWLATAEPT